LLAEIEGTEDFSRAIEPASQRARTRRERRCCFGSGRARGDAPGPARVRLSGRRCLKHPARPGIPGAFDRHNRTFLRPFRSLGLGLRVGGSLGVFAFSSTYGIDHPKLCKLVQFLHHFWMIPRTSRAPREHLLTFIHSHIHCRIDSSYIIPPFNYGTMIFSIIHVVMEFFFKNTCHIYNLMIFSTKFDVL
jgi:hypothetical protein